MFQEFYKIVFVYLMVINVITFMVFFIDKRKAKKNKWRIPESTLLGFCVAGGSVGGLSAMYIVRHKTQKWKFKLGVPLILILQIAALYYLFT